MQIQNDLVTRRYEGAENGSPTQDELLRTSIDKLSSLALALVETAEDLGGLPYPINEALEETIDFYSAVRDFEIWLIKRALRTTAGSQVRAASLLKLNPTTLNTKIKTYEIR